LDRVLIAHREFLARLFEQWSEKELTTFASMLERFSQTLRLEMETNRD
jgi:hypothetical protein